MEKREGLLQKIRGVRRDQWIVLLLAGILMLIISMPDAKRSGTAGAAEAETETETPAADGAAELEARLEAILRQMDGAGEVRVMITQKDGGEKIVEKDRPSVSRSTQEDAGDGTARDNLEEEKDETTVYEKTGSGAEVPYVTRETAPQIEGVLVLAEGAQSAVVQKNITEAVMALFDLDAHKIKVMKMNERRG